jgi:ArsR family transcriptional regulator
VCKLQEQVPIAGNLLSYHLKVLRDAGLVTTSRRGRWVDYALAHDAPARMASALPGAHSLVPA